MKIIGDALHNFTSAIIDGFGAYLRFTDDMGWHALFQAGLPIIIVAIMHLILPEWLMQILSIAIAIPFFYTLASMFIWFLKTNKQKKEDTIYNVVHDRFGGIISVIGCHNIVKAKLQELDPKVYASFQDELNTVSYFLDEIRYADDLDVIKAQKSAL